MSEPEAQAAAKGVSLLNRMVYLDIMELAHANAELTVEQAQAITACRQDREDGVCAYFEE